MMLFLMTVYTSSSLVQLRLCTQFRMSCVTADYLACGVFQLHEAASQVRDRLGHFSVECRVLEREDLLVHEAVFVHQKGHQRFVDLHEPVLDEDSFEEA